MNSVSRRAVFVVLAGVAFVGCHALPPTDGTPTLELRTTALTSEGWQGYVRVNVLPLRDYDVTITWNSGLDDATHTYPRTKTISVPANTQVNIELTFRSGATYGSVKASADGMLSVWENFTRPAQQP